MADSHAAIAEKPKANGSSTGTRLKPAPGRHLSRSHQAAMFEEMERDPRWCCWAKMWAFTAAHSRPAKACWHVLAGKRYRHAHQ